MSKLTEETRVIKCIYAVICLLFPTTLPVRATSRARAAHVSPFRARVWDAGAIPVRWGGPDAAPGRSWRSTVPLASAVLRGTALRPCQAVPSAERRREAGAPGLRTPPGRRGAGGRSAGVPERPGRDVSEVEDGRRPGGQLDSLPPRPRVIDNRVRRLHSMSPVAASTVTGV